MFLALRELKHAKLRYLLISVIMVLIVWLVLFVSGLAKGLSSDNASAVQEMKGNYFVLQKEADQRLTRSVLSINKTEDIQQLSGKKNAEPLGVTMTAVINEGKEKKIDASFFAISTSGFLAPNVTEGKMITDDAKHEAVADSSLKEKGVKLGDMIKDTASGKSFRIVGFTKNQSFSHAPVIHINLTEWKTIESTDAFNAVVLNMNDKKAHALQKKESDIDVISKDEALKGIPGYQEEQGSLLMMVAFLFIIGAFVLAVFFYVMTLQKMNQFGVLKAIGAKTSYLARTILSQVVVLTLCSLAISIGLTYGVDAILPDSMPFHLDVSLIAGCSALFVAVSVLSSLLSLYRVAKVDAVEAIGRAV